MDPTAIVPPAIAGLATALALSFMRKRARLPLDHPNARSLHSAPVPRIGGFALVPAVALGWLVPGVAPPGVLWVALGALFAVSVADDLRGLPVGVRFASHLAAAGLVAFALLEPAHGPAVALVAALAIGWMINLYNFMDGSDGLAGGMALIGFGVYGTAAWLGGDFALALACWTISAASAGFLLHNFHPARVFLGDAGSIPLGLLAGGIGVLGWARGLWPAWFPAVVFSAFVVDATVTLARRALRGERVWEAHRSHYYQRAVQLGLGHRNTALAEYALMAASGVAALAAVGRPAAAQAAILAAVACLHVALMLAVDARWRRRPGRQVREGEA